MEFLSEYGLFLAKAVTVLVVCLIVITVIAANAVKAGRGAEEQVEIVKVNEDFDALEEDLNAFLLSKEELKKQKKEKKKLDKAQKKASTKSKSSDLESPRKRLYVTEFDGDIKASEAEQLRKVITAILMVARSEDEVLVKLESQGGMVHSYGLASSQLARIREAGIPLTVSVDKVAASGGYMMACVANKIIAAPFAILGSIGVVAQLPNFHRLLKKNDVDYELYTAGEFKRTLTMFGENTEQGRRKFMEDLEDTHELFKAFITQFRPAVNIEEVATGEIWFGTRAKDKALIDVVQTSDDYLFQMRKDVDIFKVKIAGKKTLLQKIGLTVETTAENIVSRLFRNISNKYYA